MFVLVRSKTPTEVVRDYCTMDMNGVRLTGETWQKIKSFICWEEEGGWDAVTVIRDFTVLDSTIASDTAIVTVEFKLLGSQEGDDVWYPEKESDISDKKEFILIKKDQNWCISSPMYRPLVEALKIIDHLSEVLKASEAEGQNRPVLKKSIDQLRNLIHKNK